MKKKPIKIKTWWMLKHSIYGILTAYQGLMRKDVVVRACRGFGCEWDEMKQCGYSVVKVKIVEGV